MRRDVLTIPNILSLARLACIPILWVFAFQNNARIVGIGTMLLLITDILDGFLAINPV